MALSHVFFIGDNHSGQCVLPDAGNTIAVPTVAPRDWLSDGTRMLKTVAG
jgi:hypothetical protein